MEVRPLLVLVADDDDCVREAMADILEAEGYEVVQAADGQHALDRLAEGVTPCAVLLDWMMPRVGGESFLKARAASDFLSSIPVFVTSATHVPVLDGAVQGFLEKPFERADLVPMLRAVCDAHCPYGRRIGCKRLRAPTDR